AVAPALALHADEVAPEILGALEAQGQSRSVSAGFAVDGPKRRRRCDQVTAVVRVPRRRDRRGAGAASPTADAAKRRSAAATMQPQDSSPCGGCAIYSFSPHTVTKAIVPARGDAKETKRS